MFRTKIVLVDKDWNVIHEYKSRMKPSVDEFIYVEPIYFKVIAVIHSIKFIYPEKFLTVVVEKRDKNF